MQEKSLSYTYMTYNEKSEEDIKKWELATRECNLDRNTYVGWAKNKILAQCDVWKKLWSSIWRYVQYCYKYWYKEEPS